MPVSLSLFGSHNYKSKSTQTQEIFNPTIITHKWLYKPIKQNHFEQGIKAYKLQLRRWNTPKDNTHETREPFSKKQTAMQEIGN